MRLLDCLQFPGNIGPEGFLAARCEDTWHIAPVLYRRGEDLDPADNTSIAGDLPMHRVDLTTGEEEIIRLD